MKEVILPVFKDDTITHVVLQDDLIVRCGNIWSQKYRNLWEPYMVRQKLRLLVRLLIAVKSKVDTVDCLKDLFVPGNFQNVVKGVNEVSSFNEETQMYGAPSTVCSLGILLKKVSRIYMTHLIETQQHEEKKLKSFIHLMEEEFHNVINRTATENLRQIKNLKATRLPKTENIKLPVLYITKQREAYYKKMSASKTLENYTELASYTLMSLMVFNRRRAGEMERFAIRSYSTYEQYNLEDDETSKKLSVGGREALTNYIRVVIRGKLGRQ
ncbi:hypothetical protein JTB14_021787 [Gonioctena quinquepunctata]|nr:hypothetical protein JTB14_021787 [Gonioctena quinquepunctata]